MPFSAPGSSSQPRRVHRPSVPPGWHSLEDSCPERPSVPSAGGNRSLLARDLGTWGLAEGHQCIDSGLATEVIETIPELQSSLHQETVCPKMKALCHMVHFFILVLE